MSDNGKPKESFHGYQVVTREDVADENAKVQARRIDQMSTDMQTGFALLNHTVKSGFDRIADALADIAIRLTELENHGPRPAGAKRKR